MLYCILVSDLDLSVRQCDVCVCVHTVHLLKNSTILFKVSQRHQCCTDLNRRSESV